MTPKSWQGHAMDQVLHMLWAAAPVLVVLLWPTMWGCMIAGAAVGWPRELLQGKPKRGWMLKVLDVVSYPVGGTAVHGLLWLCGILKT